MNDPVPAIPEATATGEVAAVFADIRAVTGVGVVNLIWRHLATIDGALPWAWQAMRPRYVDGTLAAAADRLRAGLDVPTLAAMGLPDAAAYDRTNARALVALCALLARLDGVAGGATPIPVEKRVEAALPLPPLPALDALPREVAVLVMLLNRIGAGPDPILASMYRHLAYWPDFLAAIARQLQPLEQTGTIRPQIAAALAMAQAEGQAFASVLGATAALPEQSVDSTRAGLRRFAEDALARMVVLCTAIRNASE